MENENPNPSSQIDQQSIPDVTGQNVNVQMSSVQNLNATTASIRMSGVQTVNTQKLTVRQGGMMRARTDQLDMVQGGAGLIQAKEARMTASSAGIVAVRGDADLDQTVTRVLVSAGDVHIDQGGAAVVVANSVKTDNSLAIFLIARKVEGDVRVAFGQRESILFGAVAGVVAGAMLLLSSLFRQRRRKS